jgi:hypothetical protein
MAKWVANRFPPISARKRGDPLRTPFEVNYLIWEGVSVRGITTDINLIKPLFGIGKFYVPSGGFISPTFLRSFITGQLPGVPFQIHLLNFSPLISTALKNYFTGL